ncbi:MAG: histidine kinase [Burkholderiaceae bacterium]
MSAKSLRESTFWTAPNPFSFLRDAWCQITWLNVLWTAAMGVATAVLFLTISKYFDIFLEETWSERAWGFLEFLRIGVTDAFIFLLCIIAARHAARAGAPRLRAYGYAVLVGATLSTASEWNLRQYVIGWGNFGNPWIPVSALYNFMWRALLGGLATFVYADWQRNRESVERLHAAELERTRVARDVLQTRLQAIQARVDPQLLFDTLARIRKLYDDNPAQGQRVLDHLIVFLRTAMPQMRDTSSTLARELELARSYLRIMSDSGDDDAQLERESDGEWTHTVFPPMLLLPLVEHATASCQGPAVAAKPISIGVGTIGEKLQIAIDGGAVALAGAAESATIRGVRERLSALFGADARVDLVAGPDGGSRITLEVPHERS